MEKSHNILSFVKRFLAGTLLSRIFGAARDVFMAYSFGSSPEIGAFMVSYRLSNFIRRLLGEGSLQSGFTPFYVSFDREKSLQFFRDFSMSMFLFLLMIVGVTEISFWFLKDFFNPAWKEIIHLICLMLPGVVCICLSAVNAAVLQAHQSFFSPSVAPVFFNVTWILVCLFTKNEPIVDAIRLIALGISFAYFSQWIITAYFVQKLVPMSLRQWLSFRFFSLEVKSVLLPILLGLVGIGAMQINSAIDAIFSKIADPEGPAYLWYSIRFQQLPMGLFAIALSSAILPMLSKACATKNLEEYQMILQKGFRHAVAFMVPFTFLLFTLGAPGLNLLYGHGDFSPLAVKNTAVCLWAYSLGLLPSTLLMLVVNGFYAKKSFKYPTISSVISVAFHVFLNSIFVFLLDLGAVSIALSTSLSSIVNLLALTYFYHKEYKTPLFNGLQSSFVRVFIVSCMAFFFSLIMGYVSFGFIHPLLVAEERDVFLQLTHLAVLGISFGGSLVLISKTLAVEDFLQLFRMRKKNVLENI